MFNRRKLLIFLILSFHIVFVETKVIFSFVMFRHGARSPLSHGTDILGEKWDGTTFLTDVGIRQQYILGMYNRNRYKNFLSSEYSPSEVYVLTNNFNRTLSSAAAHLQGLFPSKESLNILSEGKVKSSLPPVPVSEIKIEIDAIKSNTMPFGMQIIPVSIFPEVDKLNYFYKTCPISDREMEMHYSDEIIIEKSEAFDKKYGKVIRQALNISDENHFKNHKNIIDVCDAFLSDLVDDREIKIFRDIKEISFEELKVDCENVIIMDNFDFWASDPEMMKAYSKTTLQNITEYIRVRGELNKEGKNYYTAFTPKMVIYSLHDYDLSALLEAIRAIFDLSNVKQYYPSFSSQMTIELHQEEDSYYILMLFNGDKFFQISYDEFIKKMEEADLEKVYYDYCTYGSNYIRNTIHFGNINYYAFFTFVFGAIALFEFILLYTNFCKKKKRRSSKSTEMKNMSEGLV